MATITIGDYIYTYTEGSGEASIKVADNTKVSYNPIESPVTINGRIYHVTGMSTCFSECTSLTQAPTIPSSVTTMSNCFCDCTSLTQAPEIPSSVTSMNSCFNGCTSLRGSVKISSVTLTMDRCFTGTSNPIYLINNTSPKNATITANLRAIAADYENVHYEADDNPTPTIFSKILRVASSGDEAQGIGTYAFITATINLFTSNLPEKWTIELSSKTLTIDGMNTSATWQNSGENLVYNSKTWYNTNDLKEHTFTLKITDIIRDENRQIISSRDSNVVTIVFPKTFAVPFSAYHDKENNTDGVAVGTLATKGKLLEVDWDAQFNQDIFLDLDLDTTTLDSKSDVIGDLLFELDVDPGANVDTDATSGANMELFNAIRKLGWFNSVITE